MAKKNLIIIVILIFVAGLVFYFSRPVLLKSKTQTAVRESATAGRQETGTQPQQSSTQVSTAEEAPTIEITPEQQRLIGVKTADVSLRPLHKIIRTVGRVEYDERRIATVNTKFEGWIERLYVDYTGRYVKKGEPLAEVYSPELYATQQEFLSLLKWAKGKGQGAGESEIGKMLSKDAVTIIEAARQRLKLWDISDEQIKTIEDAGKPVRTLTIYSPLRGYVVQKMALQGMRVMPGERLFDIADLSSVWIISDIYEYELPFIKIGQTARIILSYFPGREFTARSDYIYPALSGETRTAKVRFTIPNPDGRLRPQMFTNVEAKIDLGKKLVIPDDAVIETGERQIVYVAKGEGFFEPREVMLGLRAEGLREVTMGLKQGEKVASSATFLIDSESQLKGVKPLERHKH